LAAASGRRRWPICWCCLDRGPGSFDVEDATTLSWSSAAVSEFQHSFTHPIQFLSSSKKELLWHYRSLALVTPHPWQSVVDDDDDDALFIVGGRYWREIFCIIISSWRLVASAVPARTSRRKSFGSRSTTSVLSSLTC